MVPQDRGGSDFEELHFENLPFYRGVQDSPSVLDFPHVLPFTLVFNDALGLIAQKADSRVDTWLQRAYAYGSSVSTPVGEGSFGRTLAEDVVCGLRDSIESREIAGHSFLEVGCNKGYLLYLLKHTGASRCLGIDPDPNSSIGARQYDVEIRQGFFDPGAISEKFDVVFTHGVLEHIKNPLDFLEGLKVCAKEKGVIFTAVPNCESGLSIGDPSLLSHEHYNYFTTQSLYRLYQKAGLSSIRFRSSSRGWML